VSTSSTARHALVVGPHGVIGGAVTERLTANRQWSVTTGSRRGPSAAAARHVRVDLLDAQASAQAFAGLRDITHVVYAAYTERPTMAATVAPNLAMLANTLDGLRRAGARLRHVVLMGGGKSYGEHLGPYRSPAKETDPRLLGPIFYNDQEDLLAERAVRDGFSWTVLRPDVVIGFGAGSPMNLLGAIGVYAALSKQAGVPLRFPGSPAAWTALHQITDATLLAAATEWALTSPNARGEVFNVTNGDNVRWQHLWPELAAVFDLPTAPPQPMRLAEQMADKEPAWTRLVEAHGLRPIPWPQLAGWSFADGVWGTGYDMVQSTIKIRKAGFAECMDSHQSLVAQLTRLRRERYLP
jgi:nucleoside-diphosphate-sugar epimerase